ncbi:hypothetical protein, partial [Mycobacterium sp.]|uniref:hypothetical protein n=1 Tax=Mycobacterium sp. TaxID=1785 RepID=UPI003BB069C8
VIIGGGSSGDTVTIDGGSANSASDDTVIIGGGSSGDTVTIDGGASCDSVIIDGGFANEFVYEPGVWPAITDLLITPFGDFTLLC